MGYRKCTDKPIIHLKKKGESIPFDVNTVRTFEYDLTDLDNVEETKKRLEQTIETFSFENQDDTLGQDEEANKQPFTQGILTPVQWLIRLIVFLSIRLEVQFLNSSR